MRILIAGSREYENLNSVREWMKAHLSVIDTLICGDARGVDAIAYDYALKLFVPSVMYTAHWELHGNSAGYIRNELMVNDADKVVVFWDGKSKGSKHTIDLALKHKKDLEVIF